MRDLSTLPKVELHRHLQRTLEPEIVLELAGRNAAGRDRRLDRHDRARRVP